MAVFVVCYALLFPGDRPCFNVVLHFTGSWDLLLNHCQAYKSTMSSDESDMSSVAIISSQIGFFHSQLRDYDEAMQIYDLDVMPWLENEIRMIRALQIINHAGIVDKLATHVLFVVGIVENISDVYRANGEYQKALDLLTEYQMILFSGEGSFRKTMKKIILESKINDMTRLVALCKRQEQYISAIVEASRSYDFSKKTHKGGTSLCQARKTNRFQIPIYFYFDQLLFYFRPLVFFAFAEDSHVKRFIGYTFLFLVLSFICASYIWNSRSYLEHLSSMALALSYAGRYDMALELFDEARCDILARPYQESILMHKEGVMVFIGVMKVYRELHLDVLNLALAETITALVEALAKPLDDLVSTSNDIRQERVVLSEF